MKSAPMLKRAARILILDDDPFALELVELRLKQRFPGAEIQCSVEPVLAGGFDVYFDNVGGPLLDQVLTRMNHYGRIAVCGLLADYGGKARTAPREFDQVLMRRLRIEGFFSPDFMHEGPALTRRLREWTESGELVMPYDVTTGLENTLTAYAKLFTGANIGKVIVELTP